MSVRKTLPILLLTTALAFGGAACGDKTVTSSPAGTHATADAGSGAAATDSQDVNAAVSTADTDLTEVDRLLRDIDTDLSAADQDASTPEGDPSQ